jgi:hypothetical protein
MRQGPQVLLAITVFEEHIGAIHTAVGDVQGNARDIQSTTTHT